MGLVAVRFGALQARVQARSSARATGWTSRTRALAHGRTASVLACPDLSRRLIAIAGSAALLALPATAQAREVREVAGVNAAAIQSTVNQFRADLGALNPNEVGSFDTGRREINWDGVPDASSNPFPGDFFNAPMPGRARGVVFVNPPSDQFQVSLNPPAMPRFANINPTYATAFGTFSPEKLFAPIGSRTTTVNFFVPGEDTPATVAGFGAVFTDVDEIGSASIEFLDTQGEQLFSREILPSAGNGRLSFLGVSFEPEEGRVAQVTITSGAAALGPSDVTQTPGNPDVVALDDFIYGEPVESVPPDLQLSGKKKQKLGNAVKVKASCGDEACTASGEGKLKKVKKDKVKPASADLGPGETATLKLKLTKKTRKRAAKALDQGKKVQAKVTVVATDAADNLETAKRTIRLK
jgi:hypothetical protein